MISIFWQQIMYVAIKSGTLQITLNITDNRAKGKIFMFKFLLFSGAD